jgi:hypothetical protein
MTNQPKQIELTKAMAKAINQALVQINNLQSEIDNLQQRLQAVQNVHSPFMLAVIEGGGFAPEEFKNCGLWQGDGPDEGKVFLRARELSAESVPPSEAPNV